MAVASTNEAFVGVPEEFSDRECREARGKLVRGISVPTVVRARPGRRDLRSGASADEGGVGRLVAPLR